MSLRPNAREVRRAVERAVSQHAPRKPLSAEAIACKADFATFFRWSWHILEQGTPLVWNWHIDAICIHLQALWEGKLGKNNLIINVPPGTAKSRIVSVCFVAWIWLTTPSTRVLAASGNPRVATRDSLLTRTLIESPAFKRMFGTPFTLADDANTKTLFENNFGGFRQSLSAGQGVTGLRVRVEIVDDPIDAADIYSDLTRRSVLDWFDQAFANRLEDMRHGKRILVMQRLHQEDLTGHLLAREPDQWELLRIPMLWEESQRIVTSLGWTDPRTTDGELMFPERFPADIVAIERVRLGDSGFAGQHQQRPSSAEGEIFKRGHFGYYKPADPLPYFYTRVQSWDTAFKLKETSDYSVGFELAKSDRHIYVLDRARGRYGYPELKALITAWGARARPEAILIEDAASGQSLIQELTLTTSLPIKAVKVDGDKVTRAHTVIPTYEAGKILLPEGAPWLDEFLSEIHAFPKAAHDDQTDSFVQGIRYLSAMTSVEAWAILDRAARENR